MLSPDKRLEPGSKGKTGGPSLTFLALKSNLVFLCEQMWEVATLDSPHSLMSCPLSTHNLLSHSHMVSDKQSQHHWLWTHQMSLSSHFLTQHLVSYMTLKSLFISLNCLHLLRNKRFFNFADDSFCPKFLSLK